MPSLRSININTRYPRGYAGTDPRLIQGDAEIHVGPESYQYEQHTISARTMQAIIALVLKDYEDNAKRKPIVTPELFFDEVDLPPEPEPEPEILDTTEEQIVPASEAPAY